MADLTAPSRLHGQTSVAERAARVRFRRALALMAMTLVAPGSAQLVAGNQKIGRIALRIWLASLVVGGVVLLAVLLDRRIAFRLATNADLLLVLWAALLAGAIGWAALFIDAWRIGRPLSLRLQHRRAAVGLNGLLCFSVAGVMLFSAHLVSVHRDWVIAVFGDGEVTEAHDGRYNVLLLGGDSGAGRWGLRPDSMTVASIDADTGRTVLIGLPRNMASFPFEEGSVMADEFPDGFDCDGCYLNGVSTWAEDHTDLFGDSKTPGVDATVMAIEGITGLEINYWAMVNLSGFKQLVDAVGGVTVNVREAIPVGGLGDDVTGYIDPGTQKLNGFEALWFARAREGSDDYSRMARQKCVMNAMLQQLSPETVLRNFEDLTKASSEMFSTNLPASEASRFIDLALKARDQKMSTLSLVPPLVNTGDPDVDLIHDKVAEAIDRAEGDAPPAKKRKKNPDSVTGGSIGSLSEGYAANQADDLGQAC
ncbi:LytR family transcriptional regulator [Nocardioides immobilis]|uniref:LytR family transcriptional regulator n=1 Tax=Nocardioides immobilis TaxID=2049295 RepID=A0A417Y7Q4_9ACTN|nr:LCP family protein [Nocardioides immobilis]RHW28723.1 LytR family transcriptional regulator [Nocardioides immobilis]